MESRARTPVGIEARKLFRQGDRLALALGLSYTARARAGTPSTPQDEVARERRAQTEAFLFSRARIMVIPGGKEGA